MPNPLPYQISLSEAIDLTTRFRNNPGQDMPLAETFDAASVVALLGQSGCTYFRIYLGRKADDSICSILVAADAEGHDILPPSQPEDMSNEEGIILEDALHCPPACPPESPLNGN